MTAAVLAAALAAAAGATEWRQSLSPHFDLRHEERLLPGGLQIALERLHSRLRMDLGMFSPWMGSERVKLYVYRDRDSYVAGEFKPPSWSNGIALYAERAVAVADQPSRPALLGLIAHETTHLLFHSYWGDGRRRPPSWVNEGLAMVEEDGLDAASSRWYGLMLDLPRKRITMEELVSVSPAEDISGGDDAATWYVQAYSVVHFLLKRHSRLAFKSFCSKLRDGAPLEEALWLSYRYRSLKALEKAWLAWLRDPAHLARAQAAARQEEADAAPAMGDLRNIGRIKGFKRLGE